MGTFYVGPLTWRQKNMEKEFLTSEIDKTLDLIFGEDPGKLLMNIRTHLEKEHLHPVSLKIVKEHNNFCAIVVGEK